MFLFRLGFVLYTLLHKKGDTPAKFISFYPGLVL
jgi:hypothetical protein